MSTNAKAIVAALIAGLGALQVASADQVVSTFEWVQVASAAITALGIVWGVPNKPPEHKA